MPPEEGYYPASSMYSSSFTALDPYYNDLSDEELELAQQLRDGKVSLARSAYDPRAPQWVRKRFIDLVTTIRPIVPMEAKLLRVGDTCGPGDMRALYRYDPSVASTPDGEWTIVLVKDFATVENGDIIFTLGVQDWACGHKRLAGDTECVVCLTIYPGYKALGKTPWKG